MANVNKVILIGNVTREPEVKFTGRGTAVCEIGLAINRFIPASEHGEKREETTFVDVTLWGRAAEIAGDYVKKGNPLYVEGRLQLDTWEDKQTGQKRSKLRVVGENMQLLGSRDGKRGKTEPPDDPGDDEPTPRPPAAKTPAARPVAEPEDDDIPF